MKYLTLLSIILLFVSCKDQESQKKEELLKEGNLKLPIVETSMKAINDSVFEVKGSVVKGEEISTSGLCWSNEPAPTKLDHIAKLEVDHFKKSFTVSNQDNVIYVRAYASNSAGTGYGNTVQLFIEQDTSTLEVVYDVDGNKYKSVQIGNYIWLQENLKVNHFNNGDRILQVADSATWSKTEEPAYTFYENNLEHQQTYGNIYNGYVIRDQRNVCPQGWHVSTREEWDATISFLGGGNSAGSKLKETGYNHWDPPNKGADNESGFTALGGGDRKVYGNFNGLGEYSIWWTDTYGNVGANHVRIIHHDIENVSSSSANMESGMYIRCVKNEEVEIQ